MTEQLQKKYKNIRGHMLSKESTEDIVKKISVKFANWLSLQDEFEYRDDNTYLDLNQNELFSTDEVFDYWLENIYKDE